MLAKCSCQHCGGSIEFDADGLERSGSTARRVLGQVIDCPHCGKSTQLYLNLAEFVTPMPARWPTQAQPKRNRYGWLYVLLGITVVIVLTYFFGKKAGNFIADVFPIVGGAVGGLIFLAVAILILFLAIFWIIFPWMVYSMLRRLHEELKRIEINTRHQD
jgi:uncharacterized membrane protein